MSSSFDMLVRNLSVSEGLPGVIAFNILFLPFVSGVLTDTSNRKLGILGGVSGGGVEGLGGESGGSSFLSSFSSGLGDTSPTGDEISLSTF